MSSVAYRGIPPKLPGHTKGAECVDGFHFGAEARVRHIRHPGGEPDLKIKTGEIAEGNDWEIHWYKDRRVVVACYGYLKIASAVSTKNRDRYYIEVKEGYVAPVKAMLKMLGVYRAMKKQEFGKYY